MNDYNFVPRYYTMDPETDELLHNGSYLKDGMVVLVENFSLRAPIVPKMEPWEMAQAMENNRWSTVSHVEFLKSGDEFEVSFVATYEDRTKRKRKTAMDSAWLVKIDSIPVEVKKPRPSLKDIAREFFGIPK